MIPISICVSWSNCMLEMEFQMLDVELYTLSQEYGPTCCIYKVKHRPIPWRSVSYSYIGMRDVALYYRDYRAYRVPIEQLYICLTCLLRLSMAHTMSLEYGCSSTYRRSWVCGSYRSCIKRNRLSLKVLLHSNKLHIIVLFKQFI